MADGHPRSRCRMAPPKKVARKRVLRAELLEPRELLSGSHLLTATAYPLSDVTTSFQMAGALSKAAASTIVVGKASASVSSDYKTVNLKVTATENRSSAGLNFTWSATTCPSGSSPCFRINGTNASSKTTVTVNAAGSYVFQVRVTDAAGRSATAGVSVKVSQRLSSVVVTPSSAVVASGTKQQLTATALDQFGKSLGSQPGFKWRTTQGAISKTGMFTAPTKASGTAAAATITATASSRTGTANVRVSGGPIIVSPASCSLSSDGKSGTLSVGVTDPIGANDLIYTWSATTVPSGGGVSFAVNGTNSARTDVATFSKAGTYVLAVRAAESCGIWTTSSVTVTVSQVITSITVGPSSSIIASGGTQQLTATALDQFGKSLASQPGFTWKASRGTITQSGLFSATSGMSGAVIVSAAVGSVTGTTQVQVSSGPTIVTPASYKLNAAGTGATLSVAATDIIGASNLTYTWSVTSVPTGGGASFSVNGTNAAQTDVVMFTKAGTYVLAVKAAESTGVSATSSVTIVVSPLFRTIAVSPSTVAVASGGAQQLTASARDQFGSAMASQPSFAWSTNRGTVTQSGLFSASNGASGTVTVSAAAGGITGTAQVRISGGPTIVTPASYSLNAAGTAATLSVTATDIIGASNLIYTWSATTVPTGGGVSFSANGTNAAQTDIVTFSKAGTYVLMVTVAEPAGQWTTSSVTVVVSQVASFINMRPSPAIIASGATQQLTATALDQFYNPLVSQPSFSWRASQGTITQTGLYTASPGVSGTVVVLATAGSLSGTGRVLVSTGPTIVTVAGYCLNTAKTAATLSVSATDAIGASYLTYTWSATIMPTGGTVSFSTNGTNAAQTDVATFNKAGFYRLSVKVANPAGLSTTSSVDIWVGQSLAAISISPSTRLVQAGGTYVFTVDGQDQFGDAMDMWWKTVTFSAASGTVSSKAHGISTGGESVWGVLYDAPGTLGTDTITAQYGSLSASAAISIVQGPVVVSAPKAVISQDGMTVSLSALGSDSDVAGPLTYSWLAVSPISTRLVTFSNNYTSAGSTTSFVACEAGVYDISVTISDAAGLCISAGIKVTVQPILSRVVVMPGTTSVVLGAVEQFAASEYDQFGNLMTNQSVTWTTTGGSITSGGLFAAPQVTGSATITAHCGSMTSTAAISIIGAADGLNLQDATLASLVQSLDADGSISRLDMISIFDCVASTHATLSASELQDLQAIVANASALNMPDYVRVLASDVVNGNPANLHYQGQLLGNLASGSTAVQLQSLVGKWFLGTDHPGTACYGITMGDVPGGVQYTYSYDYALANGSLFIDGPSVTDAVQGNLGDCYFIASLGSIAESNPNAIRDMIVDNGDGTFTVRFYSGDSGFTSGSQCAVKQFTHGATADYVTVDRMLPVDSDGNLVYDGIGASATSTSTELWLALIEKAYIQWNETGRLWRPGAGSNQPDGSGIAYYNAVWGGWMHDVYMQVTGQSTTNYWLAATNQQAIIDALNNHEAVTISTNYSDPGNGLYGSHAYAITGYDSSDGTFTLYNPWGCAHPGPLTWAQLMSSCDVVTVVDTAGMTPLAGAYGLEGGVAILAATVQGARASASDALFSTSNEVLGGRASAAAQSAMPLAAGVPAASARLAAWDSACGSFWTHVGAANYTLNTPGHRVSADAIDALFGEDVALDSLFWSLSNDRVPCCTLV